MTKTTEPLHFAIVLAATLVWAGASCAADPHPSGPEAPGPQTQPSWLGSARVPRVAWLGAQSDRVVVDGMWLWHPGGTLELLPLPGKVNPEFSASGKRFAAVSADRVWIGVVGEGVGESYDLTLWVKGDDDRGEPLSWTDLSVTVFWADDTHLVVQEMTPYLGLEPVCKALHADDGSWAPAPCASGDMVQLYAVKPGPDETIVAFSAGEGHPAVNVARYSLDAGQRAVEVPAFDLYPSGPATVVVANDAKRLHIATPCDLTRCERPCEEVAEGGPWRWFTADLPGTGITLHRDGLPADFVPAADGVRITWGEPGAACVGDPAEPASKLCVKVPGAP